MIQKFRDSEFLKNILVLFSGTLLSQLLPFLVLPILQKFYYTPSDFGLLAFFIAICDLFARISTFKLEFGIVIQHRAKDAVNLMAGAFRISWWVVLSSILLIVFFQDLLLEYFEVPELKNYLFLVPVYILVVSTNDIASYWFNRSKKFSIISFSKVYQTIATESLKLITGILNFGFIGLVISRVVGFFTSNLVFLIQFLRLDKQNLKLLNKQHRIKMVKENRDFMIYSTPSVFIGNLINFSYLNLFLFYFGQEIVGEMSVSMIYISAGYGMIALSFSQVFYSKIASIHSKTEMLSVYKRFLKNLAALSGIPILFIYLIPKEMVAGFLGHEWIELVPIARIMVLWLSVWFVASSLSFIYIRLRKQKAMLFYDLLHLVMIVIGFFTAMMIQPTFFSALWGFTIAQICYYLFVIYLAVYFIKEMKEE